MIFLMFLNKFEKIHKGVLLVAWSETKNIIGSNYP